MKIYDKYQAQISILNNSTIDPIIYKSQKEKDKIFFDIVGKHIQKDNTVRKDAFKKMFTQKLSSKVIVLKKKDIIYKIDQSLDFQKEQVS